MIETRDVFRLIGLQEDWNAMADEQPGYVFRSPGIELTINLNMGPSFRQGFHVSGFARNRRTLKQVKFDLPPQISSVEQTLDLMARNIGQEFIDENFPIWLQLGAKWKSRN